MDLLILIIALSALGFLVYLLTTKIPMPPHWATAIQILALVVVVLYVLTRFIRIPNFFP